jgi:hypothetical protein
MESCINRSEGCAIPAHPLLLSASFILSACSVLSLGFHLVHSASTSASLSCPSRKLPCLLFPRRHFTRIVFDGDRREASSLTRQTGANHPQIFGPLPFSELGFHLLSFVVAIPQSGLIPSETGAKIAAILHDRCTVLQMVSFITFSKISPLLNDKA